VQNGLHMIGGESVIFVHDGVRCLLTTHLVRLCYESALKRGSAIPVIDCRDSVRLLSAGGNEVIDRTRVKLVQTPQTFLSSVLLPAYKAEYRQAFTDEATVVEAFGHPVNLVEGEPSNIKITMPVDLVLAEKILESRIRGTGMEGVG
jgi:2-C-methyl-D-erythritol 4-phosphate cytidylyltransferase